jgi:hypothetical protein
MAAVLCAIACWTLGLAPAERIARGHAAVAAFSYEEAANEFSLAATAPDATEAERMEASLHAGIATRIVGNDVAARAAFYYVLARDPTATLPADCGPNVQTFFDELRQDLDIERHVASAPGAAAPLSTPGPGSTAPAPADTGSIVPIIVIGSGGALLLGGLAGALGVEVALADANAPVSDREPLKGLGWVAAGGVVIGAVLVAGGYLSWGRP